MDEPEICLGSIEILVIVFWILSNRREMKTDGTRKLSRFPTQTTEFMAIEKKGSGMEEGQVSEKNTFNLEVEIKDIVRYPAEDVLEAADSRS